MVADREQWFVRAAQGDLWRRNGHAEFLDEDEGAEHGSVKELVEVVTKSVREADDVGKE